MAILHKHGSRFVGVRAEQQWLRFVIQPALVLRAPRVGSHVNSPATSRTRTRCQVSSQWIALCYILTCILVIIPYTRLLLVLCAYNQFNLLIFRYHKVSNGALMGPAIGSLSRFSASRVSSVLDSKTSRFLRHNLKGFL